MWPSLNKSVLAGAALTVGLGALCGCSNTQHESAWEQTSTRSAELFQAGEMTEATTLAREAVEIAEREFGPDDDRVLSSLLSLGTMLFVQGKLEEVESVAMQAYEMSERKLTSAQAKVVVTLKYLGVAYMQQNKLDQAEPILRRAIELSEATSGPEHPETAKHIGNLGAMYLKQGDNERGRLLLDRALQIWDQQPEPNPVYTVTAMSNRATLYMRDGNEAEALRLHREGLAIQEAAFGKDHPQLLNHLRGYAAALRETGRADDAEELEARIKQLSASSAN